MATIMRRGGAEEPIATPPVDAAPQSETVDKPKRNAKPHYPGLEAAMNSETGKMVATKKLKELPVDYDEEKFRRLTRKDFEEEPVYLDFCAESCERKAAAYREEAAASRALGSAETRKKATKLKKYLGEYNKLRADLIKAGIDVESLTPEAS